MVKEYLDKFMAALSKGLSWLPALGFGLQWEVGGKVVKLWPFVAAGLVLAVVVLVL